MRHAMKWLKQMDGGIYTILALMWVCVALSFQSFPFLFLVVLIILFSCSVRKKYKEDMARPHANTDLREVYPPVKDPLSELDLLNELRRLKW
jgi:hypothetical protein